MKSVGEEFPPTTAAAVENKPVENKNEAAPTPGLVVSNPTGRAVPRPPVRLAWPHLILGVIGFFISLFSFYQHHLVKAGGSACGITETISCDKVLTSQYAEIFGIPLGLYGMAYFVVVVLTAITTEPLTTPLRKIALPRLLVAAAGLLGSAILTYISIVQIKALCPVCLATHTTVLLNFLFALTGYMKARRSDRGM